MFKALLPCIEIFSYDIVDESYNSLRDGLTNLESFGAAVVFMRKLDMSGVSPIINDCSSFDRSN